MSVKISKAIMFECEKCKTIQYHPYTLTYGWYKDKFIIEDHIICNKCNHDNHVIEDHITHCKTKDFKLFNQAADYIINKMSIKAGYKLPQNGD